MKRTKSFPFILALVVIVPLLLTSCASKMHFATSTVVPAADGKIKYKKDKNNNYSVDVEVSNLADPKRLTPSRSTYVLWMQSDQGSVKNLGQIVSSSGWFSSARKASIHTVTPSKPQSFFITAEDDPNISYPGQQVVLRTQ